MGLPAGRALSSHTRSASAGGYSSTPCSAFPHASRPGRSREKLSAARAVPKEFRRMPQPSGEEGQGQQHKGYHREQERHGSNSLQQSLLAPEQRHNTRWKVAENQRHKASPLYQEQRLGEAAAPAEPGRHLRVYVGKGRGLVLLLPPISGKIVFFAFHTLCSLIRSVLLVLISQFFLNVRHGLRTDEALHLTLYAKHCLPLNLPVALEYIMKKFTAHRL